MYIGQCPVLNFVTSPSIFISTLVLMLMLQQKQEKENTTIDGEKES